MTIKRNLKPGHGCRSHTHNLEYIVAARDVAPEVRIAAMPKDGQDRRQDRRQDQLLRSSAGLRGLFGTWLFDVFGRSMSGLSDFRAS